MNNPLVQGRTSGRIVVDGNRPYETLERFALSNADALFVPPMTEECRDWAWRLRKPSGRIFIHDFDPRGKK